MTKPIVYDHFCMEMRDSERRFFAVLTKNVIVETATDTIDKTYKRGIYSFETKKKRNIFTNVCNGDRTKTVAYSYNKKPTHKE